MGQRIDQTILGTYSTKAPPINGLATAVTAQTAQEARRYFATSFGGTMSLKIICPSIRFRTRLHGHTRDQTCWTYVKEPTGPACAGARNKA